jgi:hypothetical protein
MLISRIAFWIVVVLVGLGHSVSLAGQNQTLTTELRAERSDAPSGSLSMAKEKIVFPIGCDYVAHELTVIEEIPKRAPDDYRGILDVLDRRPTDQGAERIASLNVRISAIRDSSLPPGPLLMVVKLTLTVSCTDIALKQLLHNSDLSLED